MLWSVPEGGECWRVKFYFANSFAFVDCVCDRAPSLIAVIVGRQDSSPNMW